ncbi:energy transducer TonB [Thermaurantiacus tibetensis]|uniref:energy transducer TonB n=1 Tax=Thermaurantiacus tibetensis TaxID=2759035 RepID=UPI00188FC77A|nr:energy transducer TonB [Thermaurantiacus tibetensis]
MSFLAPENEGKNKLRSWLIVGLLHVFFGYVLVSGLAVRVVKSITGPLETVNIEDQAPPPDEPPPPPPKLEDIPPYVPPPDVVIETTAPPPPTITTQSQVAAPEPVRVAPPAPPAPAPPPPAPPKVERVNPTPRGGTVTVGTEDYPAASLRACEQGAVAVQVVVGTDGRVKSCSIAQSSGYSRLDERTCEVAQRRWRYNPGKENGQPVEMALVQRVRWVVERGC